jgi:hypothetical protein
VALAAALLLRTLTDTRLFAEIALEAMVDIMPGENFSDLLGVFGPYGKALFFASVLVAELLFYVVVWLQLRRASGDRKEASLSVAMGSALVVTAGLLGASAVLIALTDASLGTQTGWLEYAFATLMTSVLYAAVAGLQSLGFGSGTDDGSDEYYENESRRRFLARIPGLALGGLALLVIVRVINETAGGGVQRSRRGQPTEPVTANQDYYIVSKNLIDPQVGEGGWSMHVGGLVNAKLDLRYGDLTAFDSQEQYTTMQCISNEVGGELISNALWRGVPLKRVLDQAGIQPAARFVMFRCVDGYTETLPLDFAVQSHVILAYQMNGAPLPQKHGFPVRLLAPGKYGVKHPKGITDVMLIDNVRLGFWEQQGWSQEARMNTSVRIDVPASFADIPLQPYLVEGLAFSGDRGISKVELSFDDRKTWQTATLKPPLGPYTWVLWEYPWQPVKGQRSILARATDGPGELQTDLHAEPYPSGATGWHEVHVNVSDKMTT